MAAQRVSVSLLPRLRLKLSRSAPRLTGSVWRRKKEAARHRVEASAWDSLPSKEKKLRTEVAANAKELSEAGTEQIKQLGMRVSDARGDDELQERLKPLVLLDEFKLLVPSYLAGTLSSKDVKAFASRIGGKDGVAIVESVLFAKQTEAAAYIIVREKPLTTYLDVYLESCEDARPVRPRTLRLHTVEELRSHGERPLLGLYDIEAEIRSEVIPAPKRILWSCFDPALRCANRIARLLGRPSPTLHWKCAAYRVRI